MAPLESCCCGFINLRCGTWIIGWVSLVYGLFKLLLLSIASISIPDIFDKIMKNVMQLSETEDNKFYTVSAHPVICFLFSVDSMLPFVNVAMALALVVLGSMNKKKMLIRWVWMTNLVAILVIPYYACTRNVTKSVTFFLSYCFIDLYGILVVYSFAVTDGTSNKSFVKTKPPM